MHPFPTGTVTLLFSDIEGSTQLLRHVGAGYGDLLAHCRQVLRTAFQQYHGHEVDTQGDSFFVAFARATDAVSAATEAQRTLAGQVWPEGIAVYVRMGLHTGEPHLTSDGYVGLDVHQAARIMHAAHGGQVLLSQTTVDLVEQDLPEGVCLHPMGAYRLKDMPRPISLFQLVIAGLPAEFPALKTLAAHSNHLPVPLTPLIGRTREVATLLTLLNREAVRLLTLTGPGGTGKTRLGLQVVTEKQEQFADGVYFVNLAPVRDPGVVLAAIAQTLALKETGTLPLFDLLLAFLRDKQLLLLLDNFEQVLGAAPQLANLLARCPHLKIVVTSRERLRVQGEQEFAVPPLTVPDPNHLPDLVAFSQYEAVTLFIQRAQAVDPNFQITNATVASVADICVQLDGLPLAIELAAARSKLLPPQALLARLGRRLAVLTSGPRDMPLRQQTLRNTIAWSYDLLNTDEQRLFRRLSVFAGGATLEAIEAISTALGDEPGLILDRIASLLDKNLIRQRAREGEEPRLWMLETLREFGLEALNANGEMETVQRAHAEYYLTLAQRLGTYPQQPSAQLGLDPLERDHDNLRNALQWALEQEERELALRAGGALWWFWVVRGPLSEGRTFLEKALAESEEIHTLARAKALYGAAVLAFFHGDRTQTTLLCEESLALYQQLRDKDGIATCLYRLGHVAIVKRDYARACVLEEQALTIFRETGNQWGSSVVHLRLGEVALLQRDFARARSLFEVSLAISRTLGDTYGILTTLSFLGEVANCQGEDGRAGPLFEESLALARELDDKLSIIGGLNSLMEVALWQDDLVKAQALLEEVLARKKELGGHHQQGEAAWGLSDRARIELRQEQFTTARVHFQESLALARAWGKENFMDLIACCFVGLAEVATAQDQPAWAARLWGAAEIIHEDLGLPMPAQFNERPLYERAIAQARADLGEHAFAAAWAEGRTMTPEQVLSARSSVIVLSPQPSLPPVEKLPPTYLDGLTTREVEVLRLVAQGLSNAEIADQLIISLLTVKAHMRSLYNKLGISSRSAATRYAIEHSLL